MNITVGYRRALYMFTTVLSLCLRWIVVTCGWSFPFWNSNLKLIISVSWFQESNFMWKLSWEEPKSSIECGHAYYFVNIYRRRIFCSTFFIFYTKMKENRKSVLVQRRKWWNLEESTATAHESLTRCCPNESRSGVITLSASPINFISSFLFSFRNPRFFSFFIVIIISVSGTNIHYSFQVFPSCCFDKVCFTSNPFAPISTNRVSPRS